MAEDQTNVLRGTFRQTVPETYEQQEKDAQMIFNQITSGYFESYQEAERVVATVYLVDPEISRAGISRALEMLKTHYSKPRSEACTSSGKARMGNLE